MTTTLDLNGAFVVPLLSEAAADAALYGPKAANQAALGQAGLPIPDGFAVSAEAYRAQLAHCGLTEKVAKHTDTEPTEARHLANDIRLALFKTDIAPAVLEELIAARNLLVERYGDEPIVVRSSALVEDRAGSSFAGQFESFLGLKTEAEFLTAVRACWAALWSVRALRYMGGHDIDPASTGMGLVVQQLVSARASGGGLSRTAQGGMTLSATWGLGEAIAQGEVVPDRYELDAAGHIEHVDTGRKTHKIGCDLHEPSRVVHHHEATERCLDDTQVAELATYLKRAEALLGVPAEIEWAMDRHGIKMLQVRPLAVVEETEVDETWARRPGLRGHPAGVGWGAGRATVINCECELSRVAPGDVLVTRVAGPSLAHMLPQVAGVVAELGGSTSHLASLARERGIPMVLGVHDATLNIPDGAKVAVDGVAGIVRWMEG